MPNLAIRSINPNFRRLWIGQSLALAGTQFGALAFPLVAITVLDATPAELGILAGMAGLPWLFFGLFVGVGVDRFRRRPILIAADFGRGILVGWIPISAWLGILTIGQLYLITFVLGTLTVCFETAYQSFLPAVVDRRDLVEANAKLAMTESVTSVAGPSIAGFVIQVTTAPLGLLVDAASFLASAVMVRRIDSPEPAPKATREEHVLWSLRQGVVLLWRLKTIRWFTLSNATFMLFFTVSQAVVFIFYTRDLGLEAGIIGVIFAVGNIGALLGAATATRIGNRFGPGPSILAGSVLRACGVASIPLAIVLSALAVPVLVVAQFIQAFGWSIWSVHQGSTRQILVPDAVRGRVNGSFLFLVRGMTAVGGFLAAFVADRSGVKGTLVAAAVGVLIGSLWLLPAGLWSMRSTPHGPEDVVHDVVGS